MTNRIAIVDQKRCKPEKCKKECISHCPPQSSGKEVIKIVDIEDIGEIGKEVKEMKDKKKIANIVEKQCIGCNICVKKCPFNAIRIVNLPFENKSDIVHRYTPNGFSLYKLPILKKNIVLGIIGENGVGKSTLINILSNQIKPNFESFKEELTTKQILSKYRGSVLYDYLKALYSNQLTISVKSQRLFIKEEDKEVKVRDFLFSKDLKDEKEEEKKLLSRLELDHLLDANIKNLSGGELQRLFFYSTISKEADVYIFDEPSNYLDIKQRLEVTKIIREMVHPDKYIIVIDHDMSMVDYLADEIVILYGKPSMYGIVSNPMTTLEGINNYMDGYIPTENVRFREEEFNLKPSSMLSSISSSIDQTKKEEKEDLSYLSYEDKTIHYESSKFKLNIPSDKIDINGTIHVIMAENANGKSTFLKYIARVSKTPVSHKEQTLNIKKYIDKSGKYPTVNELFYSYIHLSYTDGRFINDVVRPLEIKDIAERRLNELSGGELQRVFLVLCLGTQASIYMIDEPSANLDIEKRMTVIKVIKRFILGNKKSAYIIEHDMMMAVAFSQEYTSRILTIDKEIKEEKEEKYRECTVSSYLAFHEGITKFLKTLNITMRISSHNRPRINKLDSQLDKEQKFSNEYYS